MIWMLPMLKLFDNNKQSVQPCISNCHEFQGWSIKKAGVVTNSTCLWLPSILNHFGSPHSAFNNMLKTCTEFLPYGVSPGITFSYSLPQVCPCFYPLTLKGLSIYILCHLIVSCVTSTFWWVQEKFYVLVYLGFYSHWIGSLQIFYIIHMCIYIYVHTYIWKILCDFKLMFLLINFIQK